ncbi:pyridoxine 5'-phosphate synthase [Sphingobacteriales bacterium UPWRP_1]|nr:pyridoxine 5'-phosphate synthase [Sphingobacteriales bacterium TSM_CSS]PSJ78929.1 pyridoxine 5'-phosphate synthase [Sphingobacteriales bacterium UPWRP_1]
MEGTRLSVNINKIALLRNARGGAIPNLLQVAQDCERFGAQGITVHPRPDERHIRYRDIYELKEVVTTEFNIEGYPDDRFMTMVLAVKPHQCTLVPDPPGVLTSNSGWDTIQHQALLTRVIAQLKNAGIRVSLFIETIPRLIEQAALTGAHRIELYTGPYAEQYGQNRQAAVAPYVPAAITATAAGLGVNAGHDLNLHNLRYFKQQIPQLLEVSIGHALICDALYLGLENTIQQYLRQLE